MRRRGALTRLRKSGLVLLTIGMSWTMAMTSGCGDGGAGPSAPATITQEQKDASKTSAAPGVMPVRGKKGPDGKAAKVGAGASGVD